MMSRVRLELPCPTVPTHGRHVMSEQKPPYGVPRMSEIAAISANGLTVISTFSGCGGSCLGFKLQGFQVLWANEFVPAAQETYRLNHPETILNTQDIRTIQPAMILHAIGRSVGEIDVLEGSPPCASFSTAGKRQQNWGKVKAYSDTVQRSDDLFFEYTRLLQGLQPKVFVAENVSGLIKGIAKGYFKAILAALKACGYIVEARLLDAQWLGVPQMRQRIIFLGVRQDLVETYGIMPVFPKPLSYRYSVRDVLPEIMGIEEANGYAKHRLYGTGQPIDTIQAQRPISVAVSRADRDKLGAFGHEGDDTDIPEPTVLSDSIGTHGIEPETDISQYAIGRAWGVLQPGEQSEKYFQLVRPALGRPCPTVTQRGGDPTVASVTHPTERRKFTIAELKRICAFPDDFRLTGTYAQQWERLGRAVPPVMMSHVARVIRDDILLKLPRT